MIIWVVKISFVHFFCVFLPPLLNISASVRSIPSQSFTEPIFAWNVPLVTLIFLKRALVFPILLFSSISFHCLLKKAFSSLLALLWNSEFRWIYLSFSPLPFTSLLCLSLLSFAFHFSPFLSYFKVSSDKYFAFLRFFFLGMVLISTSYTVLQTFIQSSSVTLSNLMLWIYSSLPL